VFDLDRALGGPEPATKAAGGGKRGKGVWLTGTLLIAPASAFLALVFWFLSGDAEASGAFLIGSMAVAGALAALVARRRGRSEGTAILTGVAAGAAAFIWFWVELYGAVLIVVDVTGTPCC
jgi:hypothetical protein